MFVQGRKSVFENLDKNLVASDKTIWLHAASLGEYEQGLPVLEELKRRYTSHKILLTFFSPSGYEIKKDSDVADVVAYLPLDTPRKAKKFIEIVNPELAIFIKYEIWPNYLSELEKNNVPILLVSAHFKKSQIYFKPFGGFMRKTLRKFSKIFVQNKESKSLLLSIEIDNVQLSGDTRFDRVSQILNRENHLDFMDKFKGASTCFVAGSTWPEDEEILLEFINQSEGIKVVIAPHKIKTGHITSLKASINKTTAIYSQYEDLDLSNFDVLLIDNVGLLTKIYSYADVAYVGGGFKTGLHNTLEPAVFGIPVLIGPNFDGFVEAEFLVKNGGILSVQNKKELSTNLQKLTESKELQSTMGKANSEFIKNNLGATSIILSEIKGIL